MTPAERTAMVKQQVRDYLAEHPDAPFHEVCNALWSDEYTPATAKFMVLVSDTIDEVEQETHRCQTCGKPQHRIGEICPIERMQALADAHEGGY